MTFVGSICFAAMGVDDFVLIGALGTFVVLLGVAASALVRSMRAAWTLVFLLMLTSAISLLLSYNGISPWLLATQVWGYISFSALEPYRLSQQVDSATIAELFQIAGKLLWFSLINALTAGAAAFLLTRHARAVSAWVLVGFAYTACLFIVGLVL